MEYGHNLNKHSEGVTSVKVHHQPGGQSSFSLAHTDTDDRFGNSNKVGGAAQQQQQAQPVQ